MVVIKDMEMPQNCQSCNFYNGLGCEATGRMFSLLYNVATRRSDCPLIEVPEPHGDLIDRDAARGSIKPWSPEDERNGCTFDTVKKLMHTMLDRAPIIIPASESKERPAFLPQYELTPRSEEG